MALFILKLRNSISIKLCNIRKMKIVSFLHIPYFLKDKIVQIRKYSRLFSNNELRRGINAKEKCLACDHWIFYTHGLKRITS